MNIITNEQLPLGSEQIIRLDQDSLTHLEVSLTSDADDIGLLYPLVAFTGDEITTNLTYQDILDDIAHTRKDNPRATLEAILGTYCMTSDGCETGLEFREDTPKKRWSSIFPPNFNEEANSLFNKGIVIKREQHNLVLDVAQASPECSELLANADTVKDLSWNSADGCGDEEVARLWKHVDNCLDIGKLLVREICGRDDYKELEEKAAAVRGEYYSVIDKNREVKNLVNDALPKLALKVGFIGLTKPRNDWLLTQDVRDLVENNLLRIPNKIVRAQVECTIIDEQSGRTPWEQTPYQTLADLGGTWKTELDEEFEVRQPGIPAGSAGVTLFKDFSPVVSATRAFDIASDNPHDVAKFLLFGKLFGRK